MTKLKKVLSIGVLTIALGGTLVGCNDNDGAEDSTTNEATKIEYNVDSSKTNDSKTDDEIIKEVRENTEAGKEITYLLATNKVRHTLTGMQDQVLLLFDGSGHGLSNEEWNEEVIKLGESLDKALEEMLEANVPEKYTTSDEMYRDAIQEMQVFTRNCKNIEQYMDSGGNNNLMVMQLSLGMSKFIEATKYSTDNEQ